MTHASRTTHESHFDGVLLSSTMPNLRYAPQHLRLIDLHIVCHSIIPRTSHVSIQGLYKALSCVGELHKRFT
ncbi:hypothetical protein CTA2_1559 [Colletotrichum tanaceti]|uniref:Uncharacterized protein n=1 Tax=Colletotrichum tanaceti TaxID=1306861 RepID=A0A4U6XU67_9PEZI|nr:hypothetical protein CTA2_1559 [Colletotrichum tanaceti]TKW59472.1 hypothetical protein CTA1_11482 [Colletotrichum tanaceti]